jgi:hypothetical protein
MFCLRYKFIRKEIAVANMTPNVAFALMLFIIFLFSNNQSCKRLLCPACLHWVNHNPGRWVYLHRETAHSLF